MPSGRPKGSKNKINQAPKDPNFKPTIEVTGKETEHQLIQKARYAFRRRFIYGKSTDIACAVWGSGSYEKKNIELAIRALEKFCKIKRKEK